MRLFKRDNTEAILKKVYEKSSVKRYIHLFIGCLLVAISYNLFLAPNELVSGGIGGVAIILNHLFKIENFYVILIGDIILLIVSYFLLGKEKTASSILGSLAFPILVKLTENIKEYLEILKENYKIMIYLI